MHDDDSRAASLGEVAAALPVEQMLARPAATLVAVVLVALALDAARRRFEPPTDGARADDAATPPRSDAVVIAAAAFLGASALGPGFSDGPFDLACWAFGLAAAVAAALTSAHAGSRGASWSEIAREVGRAAAGTLGVAGGWIAVTASPLGAGAPAAVIAIGTGLIAPSLVGPRRSSSTTAGLRLATVALLFTVLAAAEGMTRLHVDDASTVGAASARRRLFVDPWDGAALLALAWDARRANDLERARRIERIARVDEAARHEFHAELAAAEGDCDGARRAFDAALAARARDAFTNPDAPLVLGGWNLPPTLVSRCGYGRSRAVAP